MSDAAKTGFDRHSLRYHEVWEADPIAARFRSRIHDIVTQRFPPGPVLDVGCGAGVDSAMLARRGHAVTAVDASEGMLEQTRQRCEGLDVTVLSADLRRPEITLPVGPFVGVLCNFGVLNLVRLRPVAVALAARMPAGAFFVASVMSHRCPAETASLLLSGHPREAFRRRRGPVDVEGEALDVQFLRPAAVKKAFFPFFDVVEMSALGVVMPPPGAAGRRFHRWAGPLDRLDRRVARWPVLRRWGDHTVYVLRRA